MLSPLKKPESMYDIIFEAVTKKREAAQGTAKKCKQLFKQKNSSADPNVLIQLEKVLREQQNEQPLEKHIDPSKQKNGPKTSDELKESLKKQREDYEHYIQRFLPALKTEITNSKKLSPAEKIKIEKTIMKLITLDIVSKNNNKDHSDSTMQNQNTTAAAVEVPSGANTSKLSSGGDLDSGIESPRTNEESSESPVSSRRSSVSSVSSPVGGNDNLQKENENQMQPEQAVKEEPQVQESGNKAVLSKQEASNDENNSEDTPPTKQPNNRNLHVALVAGCALSTIGCIVAGAMTSGLVGAGLLAMAAVFAIAAVAELHSNFLSSKLTSINVSPLVDDKELTACSQR